MPARPSTTDVLVCAGFTAAGLTEICLRARDAGDAAALVPGLVAYLTLLWRRTRPATALATYCAVGIVGTLAQWLMDVPEQQATVPIVALLLLTWSLGAYAGLRGVLLAAPMPVVLVAVVDLTDPSVGDLASALPFVSLVVVLVPVLAGRLAWSRRRLVASLAQRDAGAEAAHAARLRADRAEHAWADAHDLQVRLDTGLAGLVDVLDRALAGTAPVAAVETTARELLGTTRSAVVRLSSAPGGVAGRTEAPALVRRSSPRDWSVTLLVGTAWAIAWVYDATAIPLTDSFVVALLGLLTGLAAGVFAGWAPGVAATVVAAAGALVVGGDPVAALLFPAGGWLAGRTIADHARLAAEARATAAAAEERRRAEQSAVETAARTSTAHDLHDSVGHHLTVVALQAGAALRLEASDPEAARGALATARRVAAQALAELRSGLVPGDDLLGPVRRARETGAEVTVHALAAVPEEHRQLVHRVVQEGLTNALRHAAGAPVTVTVERTELGLRVAVTNAAGDSADTGMGGGRGLRGLKDSVDQAGGELSAGPSPEGGFRLEARLPTAAEVPA